MGSTTTALAISFIRTRSRHAFVRRWETLRTLLGSTHRSRKARGEVIVGALGPSGDDQGAGDGSWTEREHLSRNFAKPGAPNLKRVIDLVDFIAAAELAKNPGHDIRDIAAHSRVCISSHLA